MVSVGFLTNMKALLDTPADAFSPASGEELARAIEDLMLRAPATQRSRRH